MSNPTTYAEAQAIAEQVTAEELAELLTADDNPYIFPKPRARRVIAMSARPNLMETENGTRGCVYFQRCTFQTGMSTDGLVTIGFRYDRPIFTFRNGRTVQVGAPV